MQQQGVRFRVRGLVQGVGFRPTVWRLARDTNLVGDVCNDGEGVVIRAWGSLAALGRFRELLISQIPPLARIDGIEESPIAGDPPGSEFTIVASRETAVHTGIVPDAVTCGECLSDILEPTNRRFRYPFTNCTHCGPRLSIVKSIPYDRVNTSMARFPMCSSCEAEYEDPADRRFHAQPNACGECGPVVWLEDRQGEHLDWRTLGGADEIEAAARLIIAGKILAVKGIGGFHLAADATNEQAVTALRRRKRRYEKPFALMAPDVETIRGYCKVDAPEERLLREPAAPIVILEATGTMRLPAIVAPGQRTLGFMLPYSPLHHLLMEGLDRPVVLTSGNLSEEPQCIDNDDARERLGSIADSFVMHDRDIVNRLDDSVARVASRHPRLLRRARGYAPASMPLPPGFENAPQVLAMGGELKNTFCLTKDGKAILSQHLGDLEDAATFSEFKKTIDLYTRLFEHEPGVIAIDMHPNYFSSRVGRDRASALGLKLENVQHHHAHLAACLADNGVPLDTRPILGVALDGLGYGEDGALWGGEILLADYKASTRLACLRPTPMIGGSKAAVEPWRNAYAHLMLSIGWERLAERYGGLSITKFFSDKPREMLDAMISRGINAPLASSTGRLFDAVAAVLGICRNQTSYEGQAAIELEGLVREKDLEEGNGYPFALTHGCEGLVLDSDPMWRALLKDLDRREETSRIAARFHLGLITAIVDTVKKLATDHDVDSIVLSGGSFQNLVLFENINRALRDAGLNVLSHRKVPANDGGLSLGQAAIAAARQL